MERRGEGGVIKKDAYKAICKNSIEETKSRNKCMKNKAINVV